MQSQPQTLFLEDWLRSSSAGNGSTTSRPPPPPPAAARAVLQSWADLRDPSLPPSRLLSALQTLALSRPHLHFSDAHAKLLLSLLSSSSPPPETSSLLLSLLYAWLRKSPRPSPPLLQSLVSLLESQPLFHSPPHAALLLGALAAAPALPEASRRRCLESLGRILDEGRAAVGSRPESLPEALAGIGYGLTRAGDAHMGRLVSALLGIWDPGVGPRANLDHGLMVFRLVEWCVSGFIASGDQRRTEALCGELSVERCKARNYARFAVVMAAAGILRAFRIGSSTNRLEPDPRLRESMEETIGFVARHAVSGVQFEEKHLLLQCIALGLAQCGGLISFDASVLQCLCLALLNEIFPLPSLFRMSPENPDASSNSLATDKVKDHLAGVLFKQAGAVTGVFCNQYSLADEVSKGLVENQLWEFSQELYANLRMAVLVHRGKSSELLGDLEKISEAAFLMVVVFAHEVSKHKLNPKSAHEFLPDVSVRILVAFSCVEYLRRVRLPEYTETVRRAVLTIQENAACCAAFIESMPSYTELTEQKGSSVLGGTRYVCCEDEVQTARMLFYLRVIPTCISFFPASMFGKLVAPTMFLYMQHLNEKVARASHSVYVSFLSSGKDSDQEDRLELKEKLAFYYVQRALEAYPGSTPFEGLASGVVALVRYLPAGSPAIFYCIHSLVEKSTDLSRKAMSEDVMIWKNWERSTQPCKKVLDLLLRLISLVDIQVLPYLLKQLAQFITQLPKDGQDVLFDEMYSQVAASDDVTRKPVLVSWLQSLSYLCSQTVAGSKSSLVDGNTKNISFVSDTDGLTLSRTSARL